MIRAVVWKEFREQGLIGLTLLVLGAGVLAAAAAFADPPVPGAPPGDVVRYLGAGRLATLLLAVTAGMVCGGALFAAEREAGTIGFLLSLPVSRWRLWAAKMAAGWALVVTQVGGVVAVAVGFGLIGTTGWAVTVVVYSLLAFCWGVYGSTLARTTLGSVGVAIPTASLASIIFLLPIMLVFPNPRTNLPRADGALLFLALMFVTPVWLSGVMFTRPDRDRADDLFRSWPTPPPRPEAPQPVTVPSVSATPGRSRLGLRALAWLTARQLLGPGPGVSAFAVVFGLAFLLPSFQAVLVWPAFALTAGVLAGVTMFADEQAHGAARFWGERRLPVGRAWAVKGAIHAAFAVWLLLLLVAPMAVRTQLQVGWRPASLSAVFGSPLFDERNLGAEGWKFLLAPAVYGFAAGQLCGLLFRKAVVAAGVAGLVGGTAAAAWVPSLLAGGVWHWQLWLPPLLAFGTARLLLRAWSADRLGTPRPLGTLAAGVGAVVLAVAAGVAFRVVEVPDAAGSEDDVGYIAGLPLFDSNRAGRDFRNAAELFSQASAHAIPAAETPLPTGDAARGLWGPAEAFLVGGYPAADSNLNDWLTRVYTPESQARPDTPPWFQLAAVATDLPGPLGIYEHPQLIGPTSTSLPLDHARRMAAAVLAHGLQAQADGDPAAFPNDLRTVLALGRTMRNGSIVASLVRGNDVARAAMIATDRWLERLDGRPDLLRAALDAVQADERAVMTRVLPDGTVVGAEIPAAGPPAAFDPTPHLLAERYVVRELMKGANLWLPDAVTFPGRDKEATTGVADLISLGWAVPWERERTRRLVGLVREPGGHPERQRLTRGRPGAALLAIHAPPVEELAEYDLRVRAHRRAVLLKLAVRLYQIEHKALPPDLAAVVAAGFLPAVPTDPYDGAPFRYRVAAAAETLGSPPRTPVTVRPGQAILWSVGLDRKDDGGRNGPDSLRTSGRASDLVYLVPPPPEPR